MIERIMLWGQKENNALTLAIISLLISWTFFVVLPVFFLILTWACYKTTKSKYKPIILVLLVLSGIFCVLKMAVTVWMMVNMNIDWLYWPAIRYK